MNLPNKLTCLRMLLVIPFISFLILTITRHEQTGEILSYVKFNLTTLYLILAGIIFTGAMITDFLDGKIARKNQQITSFGKLFDPLADKFITTSALICLSIIGLTPFWLILIFILRDLLVDGSRNLAAKNNLKIAAGKIGKLKTLLMSAGIFILIFVTPSFKTIHVHLSSSSPSSVIYYLNIPLIISAIFSTVSGYQYFARVWPYIKTK